MVGCFHLICDIHAKQTVCKNYHHRLISALGDVKTCTIGSAISINEVGMTISLDRDESVDGFDISSNQKIFFLPDNIAKTFPNLVIYTSYKSPIEAVFRSNFHGLQNLKRLDINHNQIERIEVDTFNDLLQLESLYMGKYMISFSDNLKLQLFH